MTPPAVFEAWVRATLPPDADASLYSYTDSNGNTVREVHLTPSGEVNAVAREAATSSETRFTGPPVSALEEGWHHVVVDFAARRIAVDGVSGTSSTTSWSPCTPPTCPEQSSRQTLGGTGYSGHIDEVALYQTTLPIDRVAAHVAARGVDPDEIGAAGGGESSSRDCEERGVFVLGVPSTPPYGNDPGNPNPHPNFDAAGASDAITTRFQPVLCQQRSRKKSAAVVDAIQPVTPATPRFTSGQTVRVKLYGHLDGNYAEFGPIQYYCPNTNNPCWGLFWDFKLREQDFTPLAFWEPFDSFRRRNNLECDIPGTHSYKVQHEAGRWAGYFSCNANAHPGDSSAWVFFAAESDHNPDDGTPDPVTSGWPDTEAFSQGILYKPRRKIAPRNRYKFEGAMGETHLNFRYCRTHGSCEPRTRWDDVPAVACHKDNSYRYDGRRRGSNPPVAVEFFAYSPSTTPSTSDPVTWPYDPKTAKDPRGNDPNGPGKPCGYYDRS